MNEQIEKIASCMMELVEVPENIESVIEVENFLKSYKNIFIIYATHLYNSGCYMYAKDSVMLTGDEYERFMGHTLNIRSVRREAVEKYIEKLKTRFGKTRTYNTIDTGTAWGDGYIGGLVNDEIDEIYKEFTEGK